MNPELFPWQHNIWQCLSALVVEHKLPHALLLHGSQGWGKQHLAVQLAKQLLCLTPSLEGACGHCRSCTLWQAGHHPDYKILTREDKKTIGIDAIREIIAQWRQTSQQGGYRVLLLQAADKMTLAAANAFLKTLEEPNAQSVAILVSARPTAIPATVLSRCQRYHCDGASWQDVQAWLRTQVGAQADETQWPLLWEYAGRSPLAVLDLLKQDFMAYETAWLEKFTRIVQGQQDPVLALTDDDVVKAEWLLLLWYHWTYVALSAKTEAGWERVYRKIHLHRDATTWWSFGEAVQQSYRSLHQQTAVNVRLLLEKTLLVLCGVSL